MSIDALRVLFQPRSVAVLAISLLIILAGAEAWLVSYLPIHWVVTANADGLLIEDVARSVVSGASIFDWRLSQAPYLFPDLALTAALAWSGISVGVAGLAYAPLFALICLLLLGWLCREARIPALAPILVAACLFLVGNLLPPFTDGISIGFALIGHHSGVIMISLMLLGLTLRYLNQRGSNTVNLVGIGAVIGIGAMSDASLTWAVIPAALVACVITLRGRSTAGRTWAPFWVAVAVGLLLSRIYSLLTPFPQDTDFLGAALTRWPESIPDSLNAFVKDIGSGFTTQPTFIVVLLAVVGAGLVGSRTLVQAWRHDQDEVSPASVLMAAVCITAPVFGFGVQLLLGSYAPGLGLQRVAPMAFLAITLGSALLQVRVGRLVPLAGVALLTATALVALLFQASTSLGEPRGGNPFQKVAACLSDEGIPAGTAFVADYWSARAIALYSQGAYVPVPVVDGFRQFPNGSNIRRTQQAQPAIGIAYYQHPVEAFVDRFGAPRRMLCQDKEAGIAVLDYTGSPTALAALAEIARQAA